jgi:hypothetical protein
MEQTIANAVLARIVDDANRITLVGKLLKRLLLYPAELRDRVNIQLLAMLIHGEDADLPPNLPPNAQNPFQ